VKLFLKKTNRLSYGTFGETSSVSWLCANRNEKGEVISTYWGYLERDAFDPDELEQLIEKNVFKNMQATFLADHYDVVIADGLPTKFDPCKER